MIRFKTTLYTIALLLLPVIIRAQSIAAKKPAFSVFVVNDRLQPVDGATVKLLKNNALINTAITNVKGIASFEIIATGTYTFLVSHASYKPQASKAWQIPSNIKNDTIKLQPLNTALQQVDIVSKTPPVQYKQGKVLLDVEGSVTAAGQSVLDILEKSPGVAVDKNGGISMQGKSGVLVMIDDKPTYLSGTDLSD